MAYDPNDPGDSGSATTDQVQTAQVIPPDPAVPAQTAQVRPSEEISLAQSQQAPTAASAPGFFDLPGLQPSVDPNVISGLSDIRAKHLTEFDRLTGGMDKQMDADRRRIQKAFDESSQGANTLKDWNEERERKKHYTDPIQAFGSLGSVFGILASAFTNRPMENALNASAAAMNAVHAYDDKEYERSFEAWKENSKLAIHRHSMQQAAYQNAIQLMNVDMNAYRTKMQVEVARFKDTQSLFLLQNGMDDELIKLQSSRNKLAMDYADQANKVMEIGLKNSLLQSDPDWQLTNEQEPDPMKLYGRKLAAFNRIYKPRGTIQQEVMARYLTENPQATAEDLGDFYNQYFGYGAKPQNAEQALIQEVRDDPTLNKQQKMEKIENILKNKNTRGRSAVVQADADWLENRINQLVESGEEPDRLKAGIQARQELTKSRAKPAPRTKAQADLALEDAITDQIIRDEKIEEPEARLKAKAKIKGGAQSKMLSESQLRADAIQKRAGELRAEDSQLSETEAYTKAASQIKTQSAEGALTDKAVDYYARQVRGGDRTVYTSLARGTQGPINLARVRNKVAEMDEAEGRSPEESSIRAAEYEGLKSAERTTGQRSAALAVSASEARGGLRLAADASANVPRGKIVPLNKLNQMYLSATSNRPLWEFRTALNSLVNLYANVIARTGVATDTARAHSYELVNTAIDHNALMGVFKIMDAEIKLAEEAPAKARQQLRKGFGTEVIEEKVRPLEPPPKSNDYKDMPNDELLRRLQRNQPRGGLPSLNQAAALTPFDQLDSDFETFDVAGTEDELNINRRPSIPYGQAQRMGSAGVRRQVEESRAADDTFEAMRKKDQSRVRTPQQRIDELFNQLEELKREMVEGG